MVESKKYRGVRQRRWGTWVSEIRHPLLKKRIWLGTFETAKEAAKAYDKASIIMNGRNAKTNFSTSQDLNDEITNNNNNININVWHTKLRKSNVSPSLTCLKLDNESNHIGVWQTGAGTKSDSKWVMTVNLHKCKGVGDDKTLAQHEHEHEEDKLKGLIKSEEILMSSTNTPFVAAFTQFDHQFDNYLFMKPDQEEIIAMQMMEELLN